MNISKPILLPFYILVCCVLSLTNAQTQLSGEIRKALWTTAGNPYQVTGPVLVKSRTNLTINPGVVIELASCQAAINIEGSIDASGTATSPITWKLSSNVKNCGYDTPPSFLQFSTGIGEKQSILQHNVMKGDHNSHQRSETKCIHIRSSNASKPLNVIKSTFDYCKIIVEEATDKKDEVTGKLKGVALHVQDSELSHSTASANYIGYDLLRSTISNSGLYAANHARLSLFSSATSNTRISSTANGHVCILDSQVYGNRIYASGYNLTMKNSLVRNALVYAHADYRYSGNDGINIDNCVFHYNQSPSDLAPGSMSPTNFMLHFSSESYSYQSRPKINVTDSMVKCNESAKDSSVALSLDGEFLIDSSNFQGCEKGITTTSQGTVKNTAFTGISGYALENLGSKSVIATHNYWGTPTADGVANAIYDYEDNIYKGIVYSIPFLTVSPVGSLPTKNCVSSGCCGTGTSLKNGVCVVNYHNIVKNCFVSLDAEQFNCHLLGDSCQ